MCRYIPECEKACLEDNKCHGFMVDSMSLWSCTLLLDICLLPSYDPNRMTHLYERRLKQSHTAHSAIREITLGVTLALFFPFLIASVIVFV